MTEQQKVDFDVWETDHGLRLCLCHKAHTHLPEQCGKPATITVKVHMVGWCLEAHTKRPDLVDTNGDATQVLCDDCMVALQTDINLGLLATLDEVTSEMQGPYMPVGPPICECGRSIHSADAIMSVVERIP